MGRHQINESGFSAIELLVTLIVTAVVFGAFSNGFVTIQSIAKKGKDIAQANTLAYRIMQEVENKNFDSIPVTTPADTLVEVASLDFSSQIPTTLAAPRTGKVYVNTNSTGNLKQVLVKLEFGNGSAKQIVEFGNFIQRNGLGR